MVGIELQETNLTNPTVHLSRIIKCTIQARLVHISVMNGALWDIGQVHWGNCETGLFDHANCIEPNVPSS